MLINTTTLTMTFIMLDNDWVCIKRADGTVNFYHTSWDYEV